jgi:hypothetical protein
VHVCQTLVSDNQSDSEFPEITLTNIGAGLAESLSGTIDLASDADWANPETEKKYISLEQKVLAGIASRDESNEYSSMKLERNAAIFAERYVSDYAEIQRLKILSEKIVEIQKYLRPIKLG